MGFLDYVKGAIKNLFSVKDIKNAVKTDLALSDETLNKICEWYNMYSGKGRWVRDNISSLRLEQAVCREFSNIVLNEMTAKVSVKELDDIFSLAIRDIDMHFQERLATGAMIIKPLGRGGVQYVSQNAFIPVEYDTNGIPIKVIFPEFKRLGENRFYTRLEYHSLDRDKGLTITNKAFFSASKNSLGREIPLESVLEWADIEPYINYPKMLRPAFGYYRNPLKNTVDRSHMGISIFDSATEIIKKADVQFGRLDWEFESGERAVHVDAAALKADGTFPKLNKRLYRGIDIETGDNEAELFKEYSPELRQTDFIAGLEEYKRAIEFAVGLSYGDISNPQTVDKTATEIKASKKRKYNTVSAIQRNLKDCLEDLVYALAFWNGLTLSGYDFICDFKDSILIDEETERKEDRQDVAMGVMRLEEYRAKWYHEPIDKALKNLPETARVIE